jgi:hypothetical protein
LDVPTLPRPELQVQVAGPDGPCFLDLGLPDLGYAAEYDGAQWHGPERIAHDRRRREWISRHHGYTIDVFDASGIHGQSQDASARLAAGIRRARAAR